MDAQAYNFEINNLLTLFVSALDGCVINRYHFNEGNPVVSDRISVGYVLSPKQKVVADLVNKGASIKIPIIAITITNLKRDSKRVFNKLRNMEFAQSNSSESDSFRMPIPIRMTVSVSVITKFLRDLIQIEQNFIVNCNPYFYVSWPIPSGFISETTEIRNKITWDENINITEPVDIVANQTSYYEADTTFEIEGWLFGPVPTNVVENIYFIENQFIPISDINSTTWASTSATLFESLSSSLFITADNAWILADNNVMTVDMDVLVPPLTAVLPVTEFPTL